MIGAGGYAARSSSRVDLMEFFWDHAAALEALGLSEQDARADSP
jgi:hypothetical protein